MSLLVNKFTLSEDFLNRVYENLIQEPDLSHIYLSFLEDVCIAKRIETVGCWTENLYRIVAKNDISMNDVAWFSARADTLLETITRFRNERKPVHTFNIVKDQYGVEILNVIVGDHAEYGLPVRVLMAPYNPTDISKGMHTTSVEEAIVLDVFNQKNLKCVSLDSNHLDLIARARLTARSEKRSMSLTENTVLLCPQSSSVFWTNEHMAVVEQCEHSTSQPLSGSVFHLPSTLLKGIFSDGLDHFEVFTSEPSTTALYGVYEGRPHMWYVRGSYYDDADTCVYTALFKEHVKESGYELHLKKKELSRLKEEVQSCRKSFECKNDLKYIIMSLYDQASSIQLGSENYNGELSVGTPIIRNNKNVESRHIYNTQYLLDMLKHYGKMDVSINCTEDFMVCKPEGNEKRTILIAGMRDPY